MPNSLLSSWIQSAILIICSKKQKQPLEVLCKKGILYDFPNFAGKHLRWSLVLIVAGLMAYNFIKKRLRYKCFPVKLAKFFRTLILKNICGRLFLKKIIKDDLQGFRQR